MEENTDQADNEDSSHTSLVQLQPTDRWVPVLSPTVTKPMSPAAKGLNKTETVEAVADAFFGRAAVTDHTFMLPPNSVQEHKLNTTVSSETCHVHDKFNIGYAPVDIRGKLLLDLKNTGGWRAALFIFGTMSGFSLLRLMCYAGICKLIS